MEEQGIRLNKYLADSGACSRREADKLIQSGRVSIDGVVAELGQRVHGSQAVELDGRPVRNKAKPIYIALNKPVGIVCTTDPREPANIVDFINYPRRLYPIGRLDKDSQGLILLTNDGDIVNKILRAGNNHEKEYRVVLQKPVPDEFLQRMASGVHILGQTTKPCNVERVTPSSFTITLTQGLNRQIRRMCEACGETVVALTRLRIMNIRLGSMPVGKWRELTPGELDTLLAQLRDSSNLSQRDRAEDAQLDGE